MVGVRLKLLYTIHGFPAHGAPTITNKKRFVAASASVERVSLPQTIFLS
jgi:hypothetical protein